MVFVETSTFTRLLYDYLTDDEYAGLRSFLLQHPDTGDVVPGSGGVRKSAGPCKEEGNVVASE